jgi:hypothetical protein
MAMNAMPPGGWCGRSSRILFVGHDVFISYSSRDRATADAVCQVLEAHGIGCWIAPRDILPGSNWAESIIDAIGAARVMVLIFSASANESVQIHREVERAVHRGLTVVPLRIENTPPSKTMEYFISAPHWLDALTPPLDQHVERLAAGLKVMLAREPRPPSGGDATLAAAGSGPASGPPSAAVERSPAQAPSAASAVGVADTAPIVQGGAASSPAGTGPALPALSKYDVQRFIVNGRLGTEVFAGTHKAMGHPVAIRVLRRTPDAHWEVARERLLREAQSLQLSHPSVVQVRDFGEENDLLYVVTELYDAVGLRAILARDGFIQWTRLVPLVGQLVSAASAIHRRGHLLCGLSPEIILIAKDPDEQLGERLMVSSGGVSQMGDVMAMLGEASLRGTTRPSAEMYYMAPELFIGGSPNMLSEVFTLAAVIYEMATGRRPFDAPTFPTLLGVMLKGRPADPRELRPELSEEVSTALLGALSHDPDQRPPTPVALGAALFAKPH